MAAQGDNLSSTTSCDRDPCSELHCPHSSVRRRLEPQVVLLFVLAGFLAIITLSAFAIRFLYAKETPGSGSLCSSCGPNQECISDARDPRPHCALVTETSDCVRHGCSTSCRVAPNGTIVCTGECASEEWACRGGLCISTTGRCNGVADCGDMSDEVDCPCDEEVQFRCGNKTSCLALDRKCDGVGDCWDLSDEVGCPVDEECPDRSAYRCHPGHCVASALLCDGVEDCDDGGDEMQCEGSTTTTTATSSSRPRKG